MLSFMVHPAPCRPLAPLPPSFLRPSSGVPSRRNRRKDGGGTEEERSNYGRRLGSTLAQLPKMVFAGLAGADCRVGREADGLTQPTTLEFTVCDVDETRAITCFGGSDRVALPDGRLYRELCREAGGPLRPNGQATWPALMRPSHFDRRIGHGTKHFG